MNDVLDFVRKNVDVDFEERVNDYDAPALYLTHEKILIHTFFEDTELRELSILNLNAKKPNYNFEDFSIILKFTKHNTLDNIIEYPCIEKTKIYKKMKSLVSSIKSEFSKK